MTTKNVRPDWCGYDFLFHIKLLHLDIILILLANILLNEIIEPYKTNFASFKTNHSCQSFLYLVNDKNHTFHYDRINWLKNKMCRHINDSYVPVIKNLDNLVSDKNHAFHYERINWLENKMCRHTNDSYEPVI